MNNKKIKNTENNENAYPNRKRILVSKKPASHFKRTKVDKKSSPAGITVENLAEMGIEILDSDSSGSSATSSMVLALSSASTDENSNEATPNLDAPKFQHHQRIMFNNRKLDNSFDSSSDTANGSFTDMDETLKSNDTTLQQQQILIKTTENKPTSTIVKPTNIDITSTSTDRSIVHKVGRSPLAIVNSNKNRVSETITSSSPVLLTTNTSQSLSPQLPSTSQQAAIKQFRQTQKSILHCQIPRQTSLMQRQQHQALNDAQTIVSCSRTERNFFLFRKQLHPDCSSEENINRFDYLSDEIILQIFKWLPKKALLRCGSVCRRFNDCARDETLWTRLDLGGKSLRAGALQNVILRGIVALRLAQTEIKDPAIDMKFIFSTNFQSKLQYLDLSMATISKQSLKALLSCCRQLRKLSLEHVPINDEICNEISKNKNLETLNLAMCVGLEAWSIRTMMKALTNLISLNISWTNLSIDAVTSLVTNISPAILRLNIAGCRKTMFDSHLFSLSKRCQQLLELDLSDCTGLTGNAVTIICTFKVLEYLSLSRCYLIPVTSYIELSRLSTLTYLDVFGMLSDAAMELLERNFPNLGINKFIHSSVARPTVGSRRTSIWGLKTRD